MLNKKISFKTKVLIPIVTIFTVSAVFLAYIDYRMLNSVIKNKTNANIDLYINNILAQIDHMDIILESTKQTLDTKHIAIAKIVAKILENMSSPLTPKQLQELADILDIVELNIADMDGNLINSNILEFIGDDYKTSDTTLIYMELARGERNTLSEEPRHSILPDLSHGEIIHFTAVALKGGGFVQLGFNAGVIERLQEQINIARTIKETKIRKDGYGFILFNGVITAHPQDEYLNKDVTGEKWYKIVSEGDGFSWIIVDNKKYYSGFKNVNGNTVIALMSYNEYYSELNKVLIKTVKLLILSILIIIAVIYFTLDKLLLPIKLLVKGLGEIAESNFDARLEGSYNDEFDKIKDAFNSMAEDIKTHMVLVSGIEYASKIQKNMLPPASAFKEIFEDYSCIWKPKDIVGGDIYWMKNFPQGAVLCVCDCTGHGTPGALLTMLVVSAFEAVVSRENYQDTAQIIWELEKRLVVELNVSNPTCERGLSIHDGCDLAVLYISIDGSVSVSSANTNIFVCDGDKVIRLRGQKILIGDGILKQKDDIKSINIPSDINNKYFIASDGLYEQIGGSKEEGELLPFGFERLEKIILKNHKEKLNVISDKIIAEFEEYRGENPRRDDLQLISFKPKIELQEGRL